VTGPHDEVNFGDIDRGILRPMKINAIRLPSSGNHANRGARLPWVFINGDSGALRNVHAIIFTINRFSHV
jgi:hypothetical protein